jgi:tetratricopeptide (TPR) repeat protein
MANSCINYIFIFISSISFIACQTNTSNIYNNNPVFNDSTVKQITEEINKNTNNASLYYQRGIALKKLNADSLALNDFKKAISIDSSKAEYYSAIGDLLFEHKDINGSVRWFEKALKLNPKDMVAHIKMAKMFVYLKDYTSAFSEINTALRQNVYNPEGYFLKGMIYKDLKDTAKAISSFETAIQVEPKYHDAVIQLGLIYSGKKDPIALKYFDNAWKLDTTDVFPLFARGAYYQNQNENEMAKSEYKNVILHDRQYANAYFNMAYILMQQDSFEKAHRQYDLITKIEPDNAEAYYNRGLSSEMMGKKDDAIADYKQSLIFNDQYKQPREALKRLGSSN